jgi:NADH-quinone oxidoreductase subunit K
MTQILLPQLLSLFLFIVGMLIIVLRRNTIILLMGIELMLNAANLALVSFAKNHGFPEGQIQVFFVITIAAAESAIGLSILVNLYRHYGSIQTDRAQQLQG